MSEISESGAGKQVIARAAAVLRVVGSSSKGLSLGDISKATGLPRTTVHRMINSLEAQELVTQSGGSIRLGLALAKLAGSAHADVVGIARPHIEALGRRTRETINLSAHRGAYAVSVDQYASDQELRVISPVGTAFPLHCTAHGKALLAKLPGDSWRALLGSRLEVRTPATLAKLPLLMQELEHVRQQGYAVDREEHAVGVCGIGITLEGAGSESYAISLALPALRFEARLDENINALIRCKAEIEAALG